LVWIWTVRSPVLVNEARELRVREATADKAAE